MPTVVRSCLTTGLALMGAGFVTAAQVTPPLQQAETRVVQAAVSLAAAVGNGQPCTGYNTDGCDISATPVYTPIALDQSGSAANIAANIVNAVASIPRAFVDALNELSYALEVTGNWWVYSPTNVLGFDPADPPKITALADLFIPFKPVSNAIGEHFAWWGRANLPMNAGCTANAGPHCPDADAILSRMFLAPIWTLASGYQFPELSNPVSDAEGEAGDEIPGSVGAEVPWSGSYVKLDLMDPAHALINYLMADPSTNAPKPVTGDEIAATLDRLGKALVLDFNPFVPKSFLLKGWPYTFLTPLFTPFLPVLCPTCNPADPGGPALPPAESAATTLVASAAAVDAPEVSVPAAEPVVDAKPKDEAPSAAAPVGEPAKADAVDVVAVKAAAAGEPAETPAIAEPATPVADDTADAVVPTQAPDVSDVDDAPAAAPSEPVNKPRRPGPHGRTSTAGAAAEQGGGAAKARVRTAASAE